MTDTRVKRAKGDGDANGNVRKQWSDWLNEKKYRAARAARNLAAFFDIVWKTTTRKTTTSKFSNLSF